MSQDVETQNEITFSIIDMVALVEWFKYANAQRAIIYARGKKEWRWVENGEEGGLGDKWGNKRRRIQRTRDGVIRGKPYGREWGTRVKTNEGKYENPQGLKTRT